MHNTGWMYEAKFVRWLSISLLAFSWAQAGLVTFSDSAGGDATIPSSYDPQMVAADPFGTGAALPTGITATWDSSLKSGDSATDHTPNNPNSSTPPNRYMWVNTTGTAAIQFSGDVQVSSLYVRPDGNPSGAIGIRGKNAAGTVVWSITSAGFANGSWNAVTAGAGLTIRSLEFYAGSSGNARYAGIDDITVTSPPSGGVPSLASPTVTGVGATTATLGATVTSDGGQTVTDRGTVWDTVANPTANAASQGRGTGAFTQLRTGLPGGTQIYYRGYASNSIGIAYSAQDSFYTEPAVQASSVGFASVAGTSMRITWVNGSGSGRIVLAKAGSPVDTDPADFTVYTANAAFQSGSQLGTGNFVVYQGTGTNVDLTNLAGSTAYYVQVYEYAGGGSGSGGINYRQSSPAAGSQVTAAAPVVRETLITFSDRPAGDNAIAAIYPPQMVAADPLGAGSALPTGITVTWPAAGLWSSDSATDHTPDNPNSSTPPNRYMWVNTTESATMQFSGDVQVPSLYIRPDGNADGAIMISGLNAATGVVWSISSSGFVNQAWNQVTAGSGQAIRQLQFSAGSSGNARYAGIDDIRLVVSGPLGTVIMLQ